MLEEKINVEELPLKVKEDAIYVINQSNPNSYTHNYFKYPCKFIPEIPRWAIRSFIGEDKDNKKVIDPFAGSGTTILEAALAGIPAFGTELDDIAKLIIKVKTTQLSLDEIAKTRDYCSDIIKILEGKNYNDNEVVVPMINNLDHWFNVDTLNDLGYVCYAIKKIEDENIRDFLSVCMVSIVKKVSNADDISPKPYVSNNIVKNPPKVMKAFKDVVDNYLEGMSSMIGKKLASVNISGSATKIEFGDNEFDLAITSPPYINAFDYVRAMRLENLWLDTSTEEGLRDKKKLYIGTESIKVSDERNNLAILDESELLKKYYEDILQVDEKRALIVKKFFEDMRLNLKEVYRVLKPGAKYVIVIGNSSIRKVDVESWKVLKDIAISVGYSYVTHIGYEIQNPYIRIPRGKKGGKIAIDHILVISR